jgi:hypothetical protein
MRRQAVRHREALAGFPEAPVIDSVLTIPNLQSYLDLSDLLKLSERFSK